MNQAERDQERHYQSLQAADLLGKYAREVALERDWPYEKAAKYIRAKHPDLCELEVKGYVAEPEGSHFEYKSLEAAALIAEKAEIMMKAKGINYDEAVKKVYADPANEALVKAYAAGD
jgi:hypothetical protein